MVRDVQKNKPGGRIGNVDVVMSLLNRVVRKGLTEPVTFKQKN